MDALTPIATIVSIVTGTISGIVGFVILFDRFCKPQTQYHFYRTISQVSRTLAKWIFISFGGALVTLIVTFVANNILVLDSPPTDSEGRTATLASSSPPPQEALLPSPTPVPKPTASPVPTPTLVAITYTVQPGDTLQGIAERFDVTMQSIVEFNNINRDHLFVGEVLHIAMNSAQYPEHRQPPPIPRTAVVMSASGLNVRAAPSTETGAVQYVADGGTKLTLTGAQRIVNGIEWLELPDGNWVQAQHLEIIVQGTVLLINGVNVYAAPDRSTQVAYVAPYASVLELRRHSPVLNSNTWWRVTDGNWVQGRFLRFS